MTEETKKTIKILATSAGIILLITVITILIIKQAQRNREVREAMNESGSNGSTLSKTNAGSSGISSGSSSLNSFGGRTFTKTEIEKMQSYLLNLGAMAYNELIVSNIRDSGGIDGKIGTGFKNAFNEAVRAGLIENLDDLLNRVRIS